jgi:uncharacterized protein with FMN-binding domain
MRRITFWFLSTVSAVVLLFGYHTSTSGPGNSAQTVIVSQGKTGSGGGSDSTSSGNGSGNGNGNASGSGGGSGTGGGSGGSGSGSSTTATTTVTGGVAQTQWGPVQVQLTMTGQHIDQVSVVQYPSGNSTDAQINSYALPILIDETVQAQSAQIDMVSGATVTSVGYLQSLQSALDQAGA